MKTIDVLFGQNWIYQFQANLTDAHRLTCDYRSVEALHRFSKDVGSMIAYAFVWGETPQGNGIWFRRRWHDYNPFFPSTLLMR